MRKRCGTLTVVHLQQVNAGALEVAKVFLSGGVRDQDMNKDKHPLLQLQPSMKHKLKVE